MRDLISKSSALPILEFMIVVNETNNSDKNKLEKVRLIITIIILWKEFIVFTKKIF